MMKRKVQESSMNIIKFEDVEELVNLCVSLMFATSPPDGTGGRTTTFEMVATYRNDMSKIMNFLSYTKITQIYLALRYKKMWTNKYLKIAEVSSKLEWLSETVAIFEWDDWYKETLEYLKEFIDKSHDMFDIGMFLRTAEVIGIRLE